MTSPTTSAPRAPHSVVSNVLRSSLGNLIEWYDFYTYSIFAMYFSAQFFDNSSELANQLDAFAVFAVSFVMRPIGSWIFGKLADQRGRRLSMTVSVLLMALGSLIITLTPGFDTIGGWATGLLIFSRLLQGLSVGGEYGISSTYLSEVASPRRRGFFSSFQYTSLIGGQICSLLVQIILQAVLSEEQLHSWGWRIPFAIGAIAALGVLWLRRGMDESLSAQQRAAARPDAPAGSEPRPGTLRLLLRYWRTCLIVSGLTCGGTLAFYTFTVYAKTSMGSAGTGMDHQTVSIVMFCALVVCLVFQPLFGALSDRIGRKPLLIWFGVTATLFTWPLLWSIAHTRSGWSGFFLVIAAMLSVSGYTAINAVVKAELFPASVRALGVGLSYGIANMLFGGTAPAVGLWFTQQNNTTGFYWYVTIIVFASLLVVIFALPGHRRSPLDEPGSPARPEEDSGAEAQDRGDTEPQHGLHA